MMEYTACWGRDGFPEDVESVSAYRDRLVTEAAPRWKREFIPRAMVSDDENAYPPASSLEAYEAYEAWHEANDEGRPVSQRLITEALQGWYQVEGRSGKLTRGGKRPRVLFFDGWTLSEG